MNKHLIASLLVVGACGKGGGGAASVSVTKADADAVNALVPADMKDKITFEVTKIEDKMGRRTTTWTVVAPKGWKKGFMPGELEPADADNFGSKTLGKTSFQVGDNCDGECKPKDWKATVDKVYYSHYTKGTATGKVVSDAEFHNGAVDGRVMVFDKEPKEEVQGTTTVSSGEKGTVLIRTWWTKDSRKHFVCNVELGEQAKGLLPAFQLACEKVGVSGAD